MLVYWEEMTDEKQSKLPFSEEGARPLSEAGKDGALASSYSMLGLRSFSEKMTKQRPHAAGLRKFAGIIIKRYPIYFFSKRGIYLNAITNINYGVLIFCNY